MADDEAAVPADFTDGVLERIVSEDGRQEFVPRGPGQDELGYELVPFTCAKCGVLDHVNPLLAEIYDRRRLWCLPCQDPHLWKWRSDPDTGERFLYPDPRGKRPASRLGEAERRELELRHGELLDLQDRRAYLERCVATMQAELATILPRIEDLREHQVPAAMAALEAIETDPQRELKQRAADLERDFNSAVRRYHEERKKLVRTRSDHRPLSKVGDVYQKKA